jgi:CheY-like chemotaxis protein
MLFVSGGIFSKRIKLPKSMLNNMPNKPKILIFEDEAFIVEILSNKFKEAGFEVKHYSSPFKNFIEEVIKEKPDIISMDIVMPDPDIDGWEATRILKSDPRTKDIPIIGFSNLGLKKDIEKGIRVGMTDYLVTAHWTPGQYVEIIKEYLNNPKDYRKRYKGEAWKIRERIVKIEKPTGKQAERELVRSILLIMMSFRTQLTAIKGYLCMLAEGEFKGKEETAYKRMSNTVQKMIESYDILNKLINKYYNEKK